MHGAPISISISYSRRNSSFVDQLEAQLKACKFDTWVDRRKIEDSQSWKKALKDAIDQCDVVLVVLSPASVTSPYVQMEYNYALNTGKRVLLLEHQTCSDIPIALRDIQRVSFRTKTEPGLRDLLIALNPVENELLSKSKQTDNVERDMAGASPATTFQSSASATLVASRRESPSIELDLDAIYRSGVAAIDRGNLELTAALWQQILVRDPNFRHGILASELEKLLKQLRSNHIKYFRNHAPSAQKAKKWRQAAGFWQALLALHPHRSKASQYLEQCLRTQGKKASASGEWELAISMWEALLKLKPDDAQATRQLSLANTNQDYAQYYKDAQQFIAENALSPARTQLHLLWQYAPYYGDPKDLSLKAGMTGSPGSPATLDKEEEERLAKEQQEREAREAQAREQRAREQQEQAVREAQARERQAKEQQEREAREARERERRLREQQEREAREAQALERQVEEQQEREEQAAREQARKRFPAWFILHELNTTSFIAWCSLFFLLSGLGCAVGIVTQSLPLTLGAIVITALLAYLLGYHRTIHRMPKRLQNRLKQNTREYSSLSQREDKDSDSLIIYILVPLGIVVICSFIALFLVNYISLLKYKTQLTGHLLWFTHSWWLGRQIKAGLLIGANLSLITFIISWSRPQKNVGLALRKALTWGVPWGFLCLLICSLFGFIFDWGFGFGSGWSSSLLGFAAGAIGGAGLGSSFIICMKGKPLF